MQIIDLINIIMLLVTLAVCAVIVKFYGLKMQSVFSIIAVVLLVIAIGWYINEQAKPDFSELYIEVTGHQLPVNSSVIFGKESEADFHGDYSACALVYIQKDSLTKLIENIKSENTVDTNGFYIISLNLIEEPLARQLLPIKTLNIIDTARSYIRSIQIISSDTMIVCRSSS